MDRQMDKQLIEWISQWLHEQLYQDITDQTGEKFWAGGLHPRTQGQPACVRSLFPKWAPSSRFCRTSHFASEVLGRILSRWFSIPGHWVLSGYDRSSGTRNMTRASCPVGQWDGGWEHVKCGCKTRLIHASTIRGTSQRGARAPETLFRFIWRADERLLSH